MHYKIIFDCRDIVCWSWPVFYFYLVVWCPKGAIFFTLWVIISLQSFWLKSNKEVGTMKRVIKNENQNFRQIDRNFTQFPGKWSFTEVHISRKRIFLSHPCLLIRQVSFLVAIHLRGPGDPSYVFLKKIFEKIQSIFVYNGKCTKWSQNPGQTNRADSLGHLHSS